LGGLDKPDEEMNELNREILRDIGTGPEKYWQ